MLFPEENSFEGVFGYIQEDGEVIEETKEIVDFFNGMKVKKESVLEGVLDFLAEEMRKICANCRKEFKGEGVKSMKTDNLEPVEFCTLKCSIEEPRGGEPEGVHLLSSLKEFFLANRERSKDFHVEIREGNIIPTSLFEGHDGYEYDSVISAHTHYSDSPPTGKDFLSFFPPGKKEKHKTEYIIVSDGVWKLERNAKKQLTLAQRKSFLVFFQILKYLFELKAFPFNGEERKDAYLNHVRKMKMPFEGEKKEEWKEYFNKKLLSEKNYSSLSFSDFKTSLNKNFWSIEFLNF